MRLPVRALVLTVSLMVALPLAPVLGASGSGSSPAASTGSPPPTLVPVVEYELPPARPPAAPLTGVEVTEEQLGELRDRPAAIVKIPNNELAHPHTGLEHADVVYEQETEGGTTRFAAVFHSRLPEVVGNIRSARPVDIPLIAPYEGVFVYAGARAEVLDLIEEAGLVSVGAGGPGYFTDPARNAPHHLYSRLDEALAERDAPGPPAKPWRFDERPPSGGRALDGRLRVLMSSIAATSWEWDESARRSRRFQNDAPHLVTGPDRIGATNVVILDVPVTGRDSAGAPAYEIDGTGDAWLLRDGRVFQVGWTKDGDEGQLDLVEGVDEALLAPGPTWVLLTYDGVLDSLADQLEPGAADDREGAPAPDAEGTR